MTQTYRQPDPRTEMRRARDAFRDLRGELWRGAFEVRPLPLLSERNRIVRWSPRSLRDAARRTPHGLILLVGLLICTVEASKSGGAWPVRCLLPVLALALLFQRPIGAFWVSLLGVLPGAVFSAVTPLSDWPWSMPSLVAHLVVMVVAACCLRPRIVVALWVLTAGASTLLPLMLRGPYWTPGDSTAGAMILASAVLPGLVLVVRNWRDSHRQVVEQVAVAQEERSRRTLLEERSTIARELHDVVAHHMSVVAIQAEAARYRVPDPPEELVAALGTIRENAVAALTELRRVLGVVRADLPAVPEAPQPTLADLEGLLDGVRATGPSVERVTTGAVRVLPPGVELSAYRIVQEALSNMLRHAPGARARVEFGYVLGGLGLRIVNTAPSHRPPPSPGAGHGILGMRERAAMLGGELAAGETEDGGWAVEAYLPAPVEPPPAQDAPAADPGAGPEPKAGPGPTAGTAAGPRPVGTGGGRGDA